MGEDFEKDIGGAAEGILEAVGKNGGFPIESFNAKSFGAFLNAYVQTNINKQNSAMGLKELQGDFNESINFSGDDKESDSDKEESDSNNKSQSTPSNGKKTLSNSVEALLNSYQLEKDRFNTEAMRSKMAAIIEANYGNVGDEVIKAYVSQLNTLNTTIKAAYPKINVIKECAKTMNKKQCVQ